VIVEQLAEAEELSVGEIKVRPQRSRREKRRAVIDSALEVFLKEGYAASSMDRVADVAGVSKRTIYNHFASKEDLFLGVIGSMVDDVLEPVDRTLSSNKPAEQTLLDFAGRYADVMLANSRISLHRLVLGELNRFPSLGEIIYATGYGRAKTGMARILERLVLRGELTINNLDRAADSFWQLTIAPIQRELLFRFELRQEDLPVVERLTAGIEEFLHIYRTVPDQAEGQVRKK
jgi:TetR/AcrR family transcriptional repressor of mexJK operon